MCSSLVYFSDRIAVYRKTSISITINRQFSKSEFLLINMDSLINVQISQIIGGIVPLEMDHSINKKNALIMEIVITLV